MNIKITAIIFLLLTVFFSCKNEAKSEADLTSEENTMIEDGKKNNQNDGLIAIQGQFIYYADAAVLQTPSRMYGVVINEKMHDLDEQAKTYKTEPTDMVPVTVRGRMFKKPEGEEGWEDRIEIIEILKVSPPNPEDNDVVKLGGSEQ